MLGIYLFFAIGVLATLVLITPTILNVVNYISVEFCVFKEEFNSALEVKKEKIQVKKSAKLKQLNEKTIVSEEIIVEDKTEVKLDF